MADTNAKRTLADKLRDKRRRFKQNVLQAVGKAESTIDAAAHTRDIQRLQAVKSCLVELALKVHAWQRVLRQSCAVAHDAASYIREQVDREASLSQAHGFYNPAISTTADAMVNVAINAQLAIVKPCESVVQERLLRPIVHLHQTCALVQHLVEKRKRYQVDLDAYTRKLENARTKNELGPDATGINAMEVCRYEEKHAQAQQKLASVSTNVEVALQQLETSKALIVQEAVRTMVATQAHYLALAGDAFNSLLPGTPAVAVPVVQLHQATYNAAADLVPGGPAAAGAFGGIAGARAAALARKSVLSRAEVQEAFQPLAEPVFPDLAAAAARQSEPELPKHLVGTDIKHVLESAEPDKLPIDAHIQALHSLTLGAIQDARAATAAANASPAATRPDWEASAKQQIDGHTPLTAFLTGAPGAALRATGSSSNSAHYGLASSQSADVSDPGNASSCFTPPPARVPASSAAAPRGPLPPPPVPQQAASGTSRSTVCEVLYDFSDDAADSLTVKRGQRVVFIEAEGDDWWVVQLESEHRVHPAQPGSVTAALRTGVVPKIYLRELP